MKLPVLKAAVAAIVLACSAPAFANLVQVAGTLTTGTGLGAVSTLATVQDNGQPSQGQTNINNHESGCVTFDGFDNNGSLSKPSYACASGLGIEGGDNIALNQVQLANQLKMANTVISLDNAGQIALVVNASEGGASPALLTDLYLSLYNTSTNTQKEFVYTGPDVIMFDKGGIGQSGMYAFALDATQAAQAAAFCTDLSQCVIGGGLQFAAGTTDATPDTLYVTAYKGTPPTPVPEPFSLALVGAGLFGLGVVRRSRQR